jgi:hypothetical protein
MCRYKDNCEKNCGNENCDIHQWSCQRFYILRRSLRPLAIDLEGQLSLSDFEIRSK